ncbi:MAG: histidine kinase [Bacteroidota bacterium]
MNKPGSKILIHAVVWLLFFMLILSVSTSMTNTGFDARLISPEFLFFCVVFLAIFYLNNLVLFPKLYLRKKFALYFSVIGALLILVYLLRPFDQLVHPKTPVGTGAAYAPPAEFRPPPPQPGHERGGGPGPRDRRRPNVDIASIILFLLAWMAGSSLQLMTAWRSSQERAAIAERDKKVAELAFLKAHINPHFLFNTLNNIYSLAIINHEQTAVSVLKLSNIMRYVTENPAVDFIPLENEIECIVDYVDLQKLRLSKKVYLDFSITGSPEGKTIAPLVVMSFIENAFKYGISNHHQSTISIKLFIEEESLTFYCQNRIFNAGFVYDRTGVGLTNTRDRLEHLYPGSHRLDINTDKNLYTVELTLQIA